MTGPEVDPSGGPDGTAGSGGERAASLPEPHVQGAPLDGAPPAPVPRSS